MERSVIAPISGMSEKVAFIYKRLDGTDVLVLNPDMPLLAASVIKLPIMAHAFLMKEQGAVSFDERFVLQETDKLPSCGALNMLHAGIELTLGDLVRLMITLSDNTATNMLIKRFGMAEINATIDGFGLKATRLNRLLFDSEAGARGLENYISAGDMASLLERMYSGELVSESASAAMLDILKNQKLKGKLPLALPRGTAIAHKTGEDSGVTHDVGIVYAAHPYIICFCSNEVDAPAFEMALHNVARDIYQRNM